MSKKELFSLTIKEFIAAREGFEELEMQRVTEGRAMARLIAFYSIIPHSKKKLKPQDLWLLEGEKSTRLTPEQIAKRNAEHIERYKEAVARGNFKELNN